MSGARKGSLGVWEWNGAKGEKDRQRSRSEENERELYKRGERQESEPKGEDQLNIRRGGRTRCTIVT